MPKNRLHIEAALELTTDAEVVLDTLLVDGVAGLGLYSYGLYTTVVVMAFW